jgi:endonuclease/exonuclease/phosphatase family metal-dependent hydrolase
MPSRRGRFLVLACALAPRLLVALAAGCDDDAGAGGLPDATPPGDAAGPADDAAPPADGGADSPAFPFSRSPPLVACPADAPRPASLRVVSWNIAVGRVTSIERVAEELVRLNPDIALLQEVDLGTNRSGNTDQPQVLSRITGMAHAFTATLPYDGGLFGDAVLGRLPFADVQVRWLDPTGADEPRIGLGVWFCVGPGPLRVVSFHGDHISKDSASRNAAEVAAWTMEDLRASTTGAANIGALLAGDFNSLPTEPGPQAVVAAGLVDILGSWDPRPTLNAGRIDFVFADPRLAAGVTAARVDGSTASDHRPLVVDFTPP